MTDNQNNYCVILAGGIGSRFWPRSNKNCPKQFIDFLKTGRTLLQMTFDRYVKIIPQEHILVVTNIAYVDLVKEQLPTLPHENILIEPTYRNTVPALTWAAYHLRALNPNACMVVSPTDQYITNEEVFANAIRTGLRYVSTVDRLLTVGVRPTRAETRYGYIQIKQQQEDSIYEVKSFTEKPESDFAHFFVESEEFFWNTGLFMWNVNAILAAMTKLVPDMKATVKAFEQIDAKSFLASEELFVKTLYPICPNLSLDYSVLEKSDNVDVLIADFGWSEFGGWDTLYNMAPKDHNSNVVIDTHAFIYDCKNNLVILPNNRAVMIKGLEGYLVTEYDGILVICKKDDMAAIRQFRNDMEVKLG